MADPTTTQPRPAFLAFVTREQDQQVLRALAEKKQWGAAAIQTGDATTAVEYLRANPTPLTLLVEVSNAVEASAQLDRLAEVCAPDVNVLVTGTINEFSFVEWLSEIGIAGYLLQPITEAKLESKLTKMSAPAAVAAQPVQSTQAARIIAFMGARGGVGCSTLSTCLAKYMADVAQKKVALVDLDPQDGSVALMLDLEPSRGLRDALEKPERIDGLFIDRVLIRAGERLSVLSAEESLAERMQYHPEASAYLLQQLEHSFDVIILDIPRPLNPFVKPALEKSRQIVLVTQRTLAGLRDGVRMYEWVRAQMPHAQPVVVASQVGLAAKYEMSTSDFEKNAGFATQYDIPFAPDMFMAMSGEFSFDKVRKLPAYSALEELALRLLPEDAPQPVAKPSKMSKLLKGK